MPLHSSIPYKFCLNFDQKLLCCIVVPSFKKQEVQVDTLYIFHMHIVLQLVLLWYLYSMTLTYVYTSVLIQLMTQVS